MNTTVSQETVMLERLIQDNPRRAYPVRSTTPVRAVELGLRSITCYGIDMAVDALRASTEVHELAVQLDIGANSYLFIIRKEEDGRLTVGLLLPEGEPGVDGVLKVDWAGVSTILA